MPSAEAWRFYRKYFTVFLRLIFTQLAQRAQAVVHRWTYRAVPQPKNVVVLGASFSGVFLARRLAQSLPTGYRVVLIEKNSHFNYSFNFPRYSVIQGHEQKAFVPYTSLADSLPSGIFQHVHDTVTQLKDGQVELASGTSIDFDYLAIATGALQSPPAKLLASEKKDECYELQELQSLINSADKIAVVGGGAVGVQLAGDIKSIYPGKQVSLFHSRSQLLPNFGKRLHEYVLEQMNIMGVKVILSERPQLPSKLRFEESGTTLQLKNGKSEDFDLVIPCIGQSPNSSIMLNFAPKSISPHNGAVLVKPTLQVSCDESSENKFSNIFAFGDVADTGGPKMARAGMFQAEIVRTNIVSLINNQGPLVSYVPDAIESALKLSLGKDNYVMYVKDADGEEMLVPGESKKIDLEVGQAWKFLGADLRDADICA